MATRKPKTTKTKKAPEIAYRILRKDYLRDYDIRPGDTLRIEQVPDIRVGDLIVVEHEKRETWSAGTVSKLADGGFELTCEWAVEGPQTYRHSFLECSILGRVVGVDAFHRFSFVEETPNGTTDRDRIAQSDLVM